MCKEMPVIPVNRVVDKKRIMGKMEGRGGGEAQEVADPPKILALTQSIWIASVLMVYSGSGSSCISA
jgi:hypothetical protein